MQPLTSCMTPISGIYLDHLDHQYAVVPSDYLKSIK